jgi:DNA-binding NtrC family response regulator
MKVERSVTQESETDEGEEVPTTTGGPAVPASADEGKVSVMILDDEPIVGKRLSPTLTKHGFHVEVFDDPVKAIARLNEVQFDIVVTDVRMEGLDGIAVLEHIMSQGKNTRVILITGYATIEVAREALVKGAFDFIAKPFKPKELSVVINKAALSLGHGGIM